MTRNVYIIVMRYTHFYLVGPFATDEEAEQWGLANNPADDPRWQTIELTNPALPIAIRSPDDGPMDAELLEQEGTVA